MTPLHLASHNTANDTATITAFVQFQYGYFISTVGRGDVSSFGESRGQIVKGFHRSRELIQAFSKLFERAYRSTKCLPSLLLEIELPYSRRGCPSDHSAKRGVVKNVHSTSLSTESLTRFSDKLSSTPLLRKALRILSITDFEGRLALRSKSLIVDMLTPDAVTRSSCDISSSSLAALHTLAVNMGSIYSDLAIRSTKKSYFIFDNTPETSYLKYNKRGPKGSPKLYLEPHNQNNWRS